jgi:putative glutamine transport system substrate-binding protein
VIAAAALALTVALPADLAEIVARGKLIVSVKNQGPASPELHKDPAHFQKRNYELEIARAIAKKLMGDEHKLELKLMPRPTRLPALTDGKVDLVVSMIAVTEERAKLIDFSKPYCSGGLSLLVSTRHGITRFQDLDGKKIATIQQTANDHAAEVRELLVRKHLAIEVVSFANFDQATQALDADRVQALASMGANLDAFLAAKPGAFLRLESPLTRERYAVAVRKGNPRLLAAVDGVIDELEQSGALAAWRAKWHIACDADSR